ncbi:2-phospho-L-lactate transferase [Sphingomonas bacterium]|uniref:2-phospho-L-lactate transferase n=1 Tax=Sphingomonas bacterium TaxID=1895847 RepID=UPI00157767C2|nr:2-phospho-L-lactate transferase [Sphingomonas bacterium]
MSRARRIVALCGGVGGAKLAFGLAGVLPPERLAIVINTGDDFEHLGLAISPDVDTVCYTLAGLADRERGWGLAGESWAFLSALRALGGEDWFQLGDRDLATHIERTRRLREGETLSQATAALAAALGIAHLVIPMSDDPVRTILETEAGALAFQHYFVRERCRPVVRSIRFEGAGQAAPAPALAALIEDDAVEAVILCPSNPYLSIDPILAVPGLRSGLRRAGVPIVAVSPIVGGAAVKGPTAKLMGELGISVDQAAIAAHYRGFVDALLIDTIDAGEAEAIEAQGVHAAVAPTLMRSDADRLQLAGAAVALAERLQR